MFGTALETFAIATVVYIVPVALGAWFVRRKTEADTADIITHAAGRAVQMLEVRIKELQAEVDKLRDRLSSEQTERAALNLRLMEAERREREALVKITDLQDELASLRLRVQRYENPITPKEKP